MLRPLLAVLTAAALALVLAACGAQDEASSGGATAAAAAAPASRAADPAPRTVTHPFGRTRITGVPRRIVALDGVQDVDALLALGVQPAAVTKLDAPHTVPAYQRERLAASVRTLRSIRAEPSVEEVLALRPDLILMAEFDEKVYDELSRVAPTVAYSRDEGWEPVFRRIAVAVGRGAQADRHVAAVRAKVDPARRVVRETGFDRRRLGVLLAYPGFYMGYDAAGHPGQVLAAAGVTRFVEPPGEPESAIFGGHAISRERLTYLRDADLVLTMDDGGDVGRERRRLDREDRLWRGLPAVEAGAVDEVPLGVWYQQTALTVPLLLDELAALAREHGAPAAR